MLLGSCLSNELLMAGKNVPGEVTVAVANGCDDGRPWVSRLVGIL